MHEMKLRNRQGQITLQHVKAKNQYVHLILSTIQNNWKVANSDNIFFPPNQDIFKKERYLS